MELRDGGATAPSRRAVCLEPLWAADGEAPPASRRCGPVTVALGLTSGLILALGAFRASPTTAHAHQPPTRLPTSAPLPPVLARGAARGLRASGRPPFVLGTVPVPARRGGPYIMTFEEDRDVPLALQCASPHVLFVLGLALALCQVLRDGYIKVVTGWQRLALAIASFVSVFLISALPAAAAPSAAAAVAVVSPVHRAAALLAPIFTLGLFAAPLEVLVAIVRAGATKPYALLPYLTMQINCAVWCMYGLRIGDPAMLLPNGVGVVISTLTMAVYAYYSEEGSRQAVLTRMAVSAAGLALLYAWPLPAATLGLLGAVFSVSLFASPLAQLGQVIASKDSSSMPFAQILMGTFCALSWAVYGRCIGNLYVLVPNALGFVLSLMQLAVRRAYRKA